MSSRSPSRFITIELDREEMRARGRIGAHVTHSRHDARELTAPARQAFLSRFAQQVDPDGVLAPEERGRRAAHALKAHMARLTLASARARRTGQHAEPPRSPDETPEPSLVPDSRCE
jgi:hypothetical protein